MPLGGKYALKMTACLVSINPASAMGGWVGSLACPRVSSSCRDGDTRGGSARLVSARLGGELLAVTRRKKMSAGRLDQSGFAKALGQDREYIFSSLKRPHD